MAVGVVFASLLGWATLAGGLNWARFEGQTVHRWLFPEQKPEKNAYESTARAPYSLGVFVQELRVAWPGESVATIHAAAGGLAVGLLHHDDIEVGSMEGKAFVPWPMPRWAAVQRIQAELTQRHDLLSDEGRYVFRRK